MSEEAGVAPKKDAKAISAGVAAVSVIGVLLTFSHRWLASNGFLPGELLEATRVAIPALSYSGYLGLVWIGTIIRPASAKSIRYRWETKQAVKLCKKQLKDPFLSESYKEKAQHRLEQLSMGMVESYVERGTADTGS